MTLDLYGGAHYRAAGINLKPNFKMKSKTIDLGSYGAIPANDAKTFIANKSKIVIDYGVVRTFASSIVPYISSYIIFINLIYVV